MKKKTHVNKKPKSILFYGLVILLIAISIFTVPRFFKNIDLFILEKEKEPEIKIPKLQIMDINSPTRPIAVMINNHNQARKYHAGLQDAYAVYEFIVEGGLTRMMALYKDKETSKIGSIRSARHYFLDYALEHDAIYVHWGYSDYAMNDIKRLEIDHIDGYVYGNRYFWRDKKLPVATEHTAFSSIEKINRGIQELGLRNTTDEKNVLEYSIDAIDLSSVEGAVPANDVTIKYSSSMTTSYVYDSQALYYKRSVNGNPHMDHEKNFQYTAKNIITYQVKNTTISGDIKGRQDLVNVGSGKGYYISNGYAIPITWEKKARAAKTIYKLMDGTKLKVNDGNTYIQIQPLGQSITIS